MKFRELVVTLEKAVVSNTAGEVDIRSSPQDFKRFADGIIWADIKDILAWTLIQVRNELEVSGKAEGTTMADIAFNQGVCYSLRSIMGVIDKLILMKESQREDQDG